MIAHVAGTLVAKTLDRVEIMTAGGVGYELLVPLSVYETLPRAGEAVRLHTYLVVREDGWQLFGFSSAFERQVFQRVLDAKGVGPALALGMLSTLSAERLVRAIREKDIVTLQSVPRVGRKKAEQLVLDLADKLDDVQTVMPGAVRGAEGAAAEDAIRALVSLGYSTVDAERAVKGALDDGGRGMSAPELIRRALARAGAGGGR
ncbi:MAG: Holliday junction branch migration protein RuvA [Gemmatimonadetes bacterium]|nr:MAG: Holliday junction branch migration protein RuvA [Gemmatimonadota bacterium]